MNKAQFATIFAAIVLFSVLYFGFDTTPAKHKAIEKTRTLQGESTSFQTLLEDATAHLSPAQAEQVSSLQKQLDASTSDQDKILMLKKLSGLWYDFGQMPVAGGFAEQVAELENADSSWSVAGGTFFNGLMASQDPVVRQYCASHAVKAFESAASLAPAKVEHRVNLALVYAENPPPDNPMQAVLMLRDLEAKHPESPTVYNALGRLAIKTGQWQKAIERLEKSWSLENKNPNTPCLLARAYEGAGNAAKATEWAERCKDR
ncbi:MAG TPA: hypothetical protein VK168_11920 [Saprospiraceae bacterium]|nr:hypothetical protein [Saprospiraceae bacterium]